MSKIHAKNDCLAANTKQVEKLSKLYLTLYLSPSNNYLSNSTLFMYKYRHNYG